MRRRNSEALDQVLQQVLKENHLDGKLSEVRLIKNWESIVGPQLAAQTEKLYIRNQVLYLHVKSAIVRNELMLMRASLIKKLNESVGTQSIRWCLAKAGGSRIIRS